MLIVRDPRDVVVSWSRWIFTPFNRLHRPTVHQSPDALLRSDLPIRAQEWNVHQRSWLEEAPADPTLHLVFYEQLVADTPGELGRMARHLGLDVADNALAGEMVPATKSGQDASFSNFGGLHLFIRTLTPASKSACLIPLV